METRSRILECTATSLIRSSLFVLTYAAITATLAGMVFGTVVQTTNRRIEGGRVDFGNGTHTLGSPDGNGVITYDYAVNNNGLMVATGRVRGTLYWDSYFSGGCARLTIRFRDFFANNLAIRQSDFCGPGGEANSTQNKLAIDHSFSHIDLWNVRITVQEVVSGVPVGGTSSTIMAPEHRGFPLKINSGTADIGGSGHLFGSPQTPPFRLQGIGIRR